MDKFSAYNLMNEKGRKFPLALDGNSVRTDSGASAEECSADGEIFRTRRGGFFRIQVIESTTDNFSARAQKALYSPDRFTAPKDGHLRGCNPELKPKIPMDVIS